MIRRALVLATVIGDDETPSARDLSDALADMNDMLATWRALGLECGSPYTANDTLAMPEGYLRAVRFNLATELAPSYGVSAANVMVGRRSIAEISEDELSRIRAQATPPNVASFDIGIQPRIISGLYNW